MVLELNDEAAEQTVEAQVVDLLQGQEGFRWKVKNSYDVQPTGPGSGAITPFPDRVTLSWMSVRTRCCSPRASSPSPWCSVSPPLWSPPSFCTRSGSWWLSAPATASAFSITNRRRTSWSSKDQRSSEDDAQTPN